MGQNNLARPGLQIPVLFESWPGPPNMLVQPGPHQKRTVSSSTQHDAPCTHRPINDHFAGEPALAIWSNLVIYHSDTQFGLRTKSDLFFVSPSVLHSIISQSIPLNDHPVIDKIFSSVKSNTVLLSSEDVLLD